MNNGRDNRENLSVSSFLLELGVYALFVTVYFFLVLHFLGGVLVYLYTTSKVSYAFVSLALIVAQGLLLQTLTTYLLRFFQGLVKRD
ncbi:MAG TPA: hypothetical protein VMU04_09735 [Candidatus Acidoferrum sp.]|nr:hypothetical protein [Candidatus Acidoferrum sp.]